MRPLICIAFVTLAAPALAQESACVSIDDDAARLACYDAANGRAPRAALASPVVAPVQTMAPQTTAPQTTAPQAEPRTHLIPNLGALVNGGPNQSGPATPYEIASIARRPGGQVSLVMSNREVWAVVGVPSNLPAAGDHVTITREAAGLFVLTPLSGEGVRVRRQN